MVAGMVCPATTLSQENRMTKDDNEKSTTETEKPSLPVRDVDPNAGLVKMRKGDQVLYVSPTCVKDHEKVEWEVC
jgi:hypothetical protein